MSESYLFLADGFEETEALGTLDVLRRAGMKASTVSINATRTVTGAHGVEVKADKLISEVSAADNPAWLICPGGMPGASNLAACKSVTDMLKAQNERGGHIAAICASPALVLFPLGILDGRRATCYPGMEPVTETEQVMTGRPVEYSGNVVTGNGPANTFTFALAIVAAECGAEAAGKVAQGLLYKG